MQEVGKVDVIKELVYAYYLCKATNYQMKFVREYVSKDFKKILSDASAKNNHFCTEIEKMIPKKELGAIDEITMQLLEGVYELDLNQKVEL